MRKGQIGQISILSAYISLWNMFTHDHLYIDIIFVIPTHHINHVASIWYFYFETVSDNIYLFLTANNILYKIYKEYNSVITIFSYYYIL